MGGAVEGGTTAIALGDGPLSLPHPAITTRPTMDRLVRVRFMALAPTAVRRLSFTRIEARPTAKVSPDRPGSGDTPSMANVADRLTGEARTFVEAARRATLATIADDGRPRLVPVCFVLAPRDLAYIPIDEKPKDSPTRSTSRGSATSSSGPGSRCWSIAGTRTGAGWAGSVSKARRGLIDPTRDRSRDGGLALRAKYPQYATHAIDERPLIRIAIARVVWWGELGA